MTLSAHPRLLYGKNDIAAARQRWITDSTDQPTLTKLKKALQSDVAAAMAAAEIVFVPERHNALLERARMLQDRVMTLLVMWHITDDPGYRQQAMAYLTHMSEWRHWAWEAWRVDDSDPCYSFDLSYGENCATLAFAYDWLYDTLSPDEKELLLGLARQWALPSANHFLLGDVAIPSWFGSENSNWNTVCMGGLGLMLFAMYEELPEAEALLARVETSVKPFFESLDETNGAWPEGIGYWNYGMCYGFWYLLSHETATGRKHPLMKRPGVQQTLQFPLDFTPNGVPCSFGDVNRWYPAAFHLTVARRLNLPGVTAALVKRMSVEFNLNMRRKAEMLLVWPDEFPEDDASEVQGPVARLYRSVEWGVLADRPVSPGICLTVRGGTTCVPHSHRDVFSYHCMIGDEALITHYEGSRYLDTTFSSRRDELPELTPHAKNVVLINGVGILPESSSDEACLIHGEGIHGIRIRASEAMLVHRHGHPMPYLGRLFLMIDQACFLIVDRAEMLYPATVESRFHTFAEVTEAGIASSRTEAGVLLRGRRQTMRVSVGADFSILLQQAAVLPTIASDPQPMVVRFAGVEMVENANIATLLTPGDAPASVCIAEAGQDLQVDLSWRDVTRRIILTQRLELVE